MIQLAFINILPFVFIKYKEHKEWKIWYFMVDSDGKIKKIWMCWCEIFQGNFESVKKKLYVFFFSMKFKKIYFSLYKMHLTGRGGGG